jgi:hypothetical protein
VSDLADIRFMARLAERNAVRLASRALSSFQVNRAEIAASADCFAVSAALRIIASGMETRSATDAQRHGPKGDSPVPKADAHD